MKKKLFVFAFFSVFLVLMSQVVFATSQLSFESKDEPSYLKSFVSVKDDAYLKIPEINVADGIVSYVETKDYYQFNVTLSKLPASNVFSFPIETKGLTFHYQPPLSEELNGKDYDFLNATHAILKGQVVNFRPENVVGSYAVYKTSFASGETGKFCHIYRPLLIDAKGNQKWAELKVTKDSLMVIADADWLAKAVYPVVIDPSFGYTTIGSSTYNDSQWWANRGTKFTIPANGNVTSISAYFNTATAGKNFQAGLYSDNAGSPNALLASSAAINQTSTASAWRAFPLLAEYSATLGEVLWLTVRDASGVNYGFFYDAGTTNQSAWILDTNPINNPFGAPSAFFNYTFSIFANYTAAGDSTTPTYSGLSTSTTVAGASCAFNATFNDETDLTTTGGYIFSNDTSGSYVNSTWTAFSSTPETVSLSQTLPNSYGQTYHYKWYFNDTAGNWNSTGTQSLTLTADSYTVTLSASQSSLSVGGTVTVSIAVTREAGVSVSSWQANITNNGILYLEDYAESSFGFTESNPTAHLFDVTGLYDADCGASVTPTCTDLNVVWQLGGGGGGGGEDGSGDLVPSPTPEGGDFSLPELTEQDYTNIIVFMIVLVGGFLGALIYVNRAPSRKSPRKTKSQLGRKKPRRESIL